MATKSGNKSSHPEDGAAIKVFGTYELLENVLFHLPLESTIDLRRVNHFWRSVVLTSSPLQRQLFLSAAAPSPVWFYDVRRHSLERVFGSTLGLHGYRTRSATLNDAIFMQSCQTMQAEKHYEERLEFRKAPDLSNRTSIYHRMLVFQPPPLIVNYTIYFQQRLKSKGTIPFRVTGTERDDKGVTLGDILHSAMRQRASRTEVQHFATRYEVNIDRSTIGPVQVVCVENGTLERWSKELDVQSSTGSS